MAIPRNRVAKLLTDAEMELFDASVDRDTKELPAKRLEAKVKRARNLRDKYRDLYQRQTRELRGRKIDRAPRAGKPNERTAQKAQIFDEMLARFEKHAERRKAADQPKPAPKRKPAGGAKGQRAAPRKAAAKPAARRKAPAKVPVRSSAGLVAKKRAAQARQRAARAMDVSAKAPSHGPSSAAGEDNGQVLADPARFDIAGAAAIQGHVGSAGRRNQARRDRRG